MIREYIGDVGHLFVILSFITSLVASLSFFKATLANTSIAKLSWLKNGEVSFYIHAAAVLGITVSLFVIISNHYFEFYYAYNYSDTRLPIHYLISTFWNGQEGSFMLWMFWHAILGLVIMHTNQFWKPSVMTVFALVQAFLATMILGVVIPEFDIKIGSSPFILLHDAMLENEFLQANPDFIPSDGNGLNPLLQNYWMVIHPPTLFLGFAATLVPFAFCMAGLWQRKFTEWVRPALPWAIFAAGILGLGILMGGYWAYETLNFGGYWNWDPVENAVYVPWLILIGAIHTMIAYKNSGTALRTSVILVIAVFVLILYSTFLVRSGVLGESSVHSFTDLGLSGQLLIYLFFFLGIAVFLTIYSWKKIPATDKELSLYSREFWIFIGVLVLCLMGLQVIAETSKPVYNEISKTWGGEGNLAPRANAVTFYSNFQLWFAVALGLLSGIGQFFWWKKMDKRKLRDELLPPVIISLIVFAVVITVGKVYTAKYIILTLSSIFTVVANGFIVIGLLRKSPGLSGGAVAHIGVGMMLIGIMASSGYSNVVSLNMDGILISREMDEEFNSENLLLFLDEPKSMAGFEIEYTGEMIKPRGTSQYIRKQDVYPTEDPYRVAALEAIVVEGDTIYHKNEAFDINPENTFYRIEFRRDGALEFVQYPRVQNNERMGIVTSPDISRSFTKDLYTYVSVAMNKEAKNSWKHSDEQAVTVGGDFFANDFVCQLQAIDVVSEVPSLQLSASDIAVKANIKVQSAGKNYVMNPYFIIKDGSAVPLRIPDQLNELGIRISLVNIKPDTHEYVFSIDTRQKDWVVLKALEKPFINVLWIGTLVLMTGFVIALIRRSTEFVKMREKGQE